MSQDFINKGTPRQVYRWISKCLYAGITPFVQSSPGMGKSALYKKVANDLNLKLIDVRLTNLVVEDFSGLPRINHETNSAEFLPFNELFPTEDTKVPEGYSGFLLFLDEFNSGSRSVLAPCYKLILDRMVGQKKLHPNLVIGLAGNLSTDKAITNNIGTALQSRVANIEMTTSHEEWLYDVALPNKYDKRILAYLNQYPNKLNNFNPDHTDKTFSCPRTWEFMNNLLANEPNELSNEDIGLYAGVISTGIAVEFVQYTKVFSNLPSIKDIINNPNSVPVPNSTDLKWAIVTSLNEHVNDSTFGNISEYIERFDNSFKILFYRTIITQQPNLSTHPAWTRAVQSIARFLGG